MKIGLVFFQRDPDDMKLVEMCRLFPSSFHLLEKRPLTSAYKHVMVSLPFIHWVKNDIIPHDKDVLGFHVR